MTFEEWKEAVRVKASELLDLFGKAPDVYGDPLLDDLSLLVDPEGDAWTDEELKRFYDALEA